MDKLLQNIRYALLGGEFELPKDNFLTKKFNPQISQVYITLFQEGLKPIRWGSKKENLHKSIKRVIAKLKLNPSFSLFNVADNKKCRILFEMITKEYDCNIRNLTTMRMNSPNRFEPGVTGLKYTFKGITRFFMPTDGYTKSIMSVNQLLNHLSKQCQIAKKTDKISERVHLMRREPIEYKLLQSVAFVSYDDSFIELFRGYPKEIFFSKEAVFQKIINSLEWLIKNMQKDGSFLYYYDAHKDSIIDFLHPNMINPPYNNILRHSGGTFGLVRGYELTKDDKYLKYAKKSIDFLISTFKKHQYKKKTAYYPFFNQKSKLGGAGIGLVAMMSYYRYTKDSSICKYLDGLVRHILSRIDKSGEMIGYYIHPKYNNGKAIINPNDKIKKELFSFYYPGEALLGLALYYLHVDDIDRDLQEDILTKAKKALDFLVEIRPKKYHYMFESLPSDAWLMQAIEEWIKVDGFKKQSYIDFVFNDTQAMIKHMYKDNNTLPTNKDYIGGFYYEYGEHVYHDASRCEGIVSAYYLAKYLGDDEYAKYIMQHMLLSAKGLFRTYHDEVSVYPFINPKKAMHTFRFKLTRHWIRVDSIQHAVCFYSRLYQAL